MSVFFEVLKISTTKDWIIYISILYEIIFVTVMLIEHIIKTRRGKENVK